MVNSLPAAPRPHPRPHPHPHASTPAPTTALYPIDTIKTRLQAMIGGGGFKALIESGGGKGLYAGVWGNLAGVVPSSALFMSVYEPVKQMVGASRLWGAGGWGKGGRGLHAGAW
jgi:hypothetical protein